MGEVQSECKNVVGFIEADLGGRIPVGGGLKKFTDRRFALSLRREGCNFQADTCPLQAAKRTILCRATNYLIDDLEFKKPLDRILPVCDRTYPPS